MIKKYIRLEVTINVLFNGILKKKYLILDQEQLHRAKKEKSSILHTINIDNIFIIYCYI